MQLAKLAKACIPWQWKLWLKARRDPEIATPKDLLYCYRLILGREPDPDGWETFMASIRPGGMPRTRLVRAFYESVEFNMMQSGDDANEEVPVLVRLPEFQIYIRDAKSTVGHAIYHDHCYEPEVTQGRGATSKDTRYGLT